MAQKLNQILISVIILTLLAMMLFLYFKGSTQEFSLSSFSQAVSVQGKDEYQIAELVTQESYEHTKMNNAPIIDLPIGDTTVKLSLVAHFNYYIKLSELNISLQDEVLRVHAKSLYLAEPVAFDLATLKEESETVGWGPGKETMEAEIRLLASKELSAKGRRALPTVIDKAAKALADNLNSFHKRHGDAGFYKTIEVSFGNERTASKRLFSYENSLCEPGPCRFELDIGEDKRFLIR